MSDTRSFGNIERTLIREYWGRFLIELIQNARDAWLEANPGKRGGRLLIKLTQEPALIVANSGAPITDDIVLDSLSKVGESTKQYGEGIGYKGIGFKAVLGLSATPEIYSRDRASEEWGMRVRYDPEEARALVRDHSPNWDQLVSELVSASQDEDGDDRIPVLRFPLWVDEPPDWLALLDGGANELNTVIRLPYDERYADRIGIDREGFVERVQTAIADITDEIALLIAVFEQIVIDDQVAGTSTTIGRHIRLEQSLVGETRLSDVEILRDGHVSSRWWTWERSLPGFDRLEGDIQVAARLTQEADGRLVPVLPASASGGNGGENFHLFFPTGIKTHLPLLLHAYFEVDASRKAFAPDKVTLNTRLLDGLRSLAVEAVRHLTRTTQAGEVAIEALPALFGATAGDPDDGLAAAFRDRLLAALDETKFVPTHPHGRRQLAAPAELLVDSRPPMPSLLPIAFPAAYIADRLGKHHPDLSIDIDGLEFLEGRAELAGDAGRLSAETLGVLLRPGERAIWKDQPDLGFRALLEVLTYLAAVDRSVGTVLQDLGGEDDAAIIPVIATNGGRTMRPPPPTSRSVEGPRGQILARIRASSDTPLAPPDALPIDFLADGVVDAALLAGAAQTLGIRPYTTDGVLDALVGPDLTAGDGESLLRFIWRLLLREGQSDAGLRATLGQAAGFDPGSFWWLRSSGKYLADSERVVQRRFRALASCLVPTTNVIARAAGQVVFGSAWADWCATQGTVASRERAAAYRDLEASAPGSDFVVAGPDELAELLPLDERDAEWLTGPDVPTLPDQPRDRHRALLHAFLLRLGVWEIPPIVSVVDLTDRSQADRDPWQGVSLRDQHERSVHAGASFYARHENVHVGEDSRFAWPMRPDAALIAGLNRGVAFYRRHVETLRFCPRCRGHTARKLSSEDGSLPSMLDWELRNRPWVPALRQGAPVPALLAREAWYERQLPDPTRWLQSWPRFLPLVDPSVSGALADLAGITGLDSASGARISNLLSQLRQEFDDDEIEPQRRSTSFAGQAFTSLHRRAYQRLADLGDSHASSTAEEVGVLAVKGKTLVFVPPQDARHDDGVHVAQKRFFVGLVPFVTLDREHGRVADALGVRRFRLNVERLPGGNPEDVTDRIRQIVHERAAEFLTLQAFYPLTGQTLQLDSQAFTERAARLRDLRVIRVDDLRLELRLVGGEALIEIGGEREGDAYLDLSEAPPTLYHDLVGEGWEERLRALMGAQLATLLDNPAYANTFSLLLQQDSPAQREAFFSELNIAEDDIELVRRALGAEAGALEAAERRWWDALLPMLGADPPEEHDPTAYRESVRRAFHDLGVLAGDNSLGDVLLRAGGGEEVRRDTSQGGPLSVLEHHGLSLAELDARLRATGDSGLEISVAAAALREWKSRHGDEVAVLLTHRQWSLEAARATARAWRTPDEAAYIVHAAPDLYLQPVLATLADAGLTVDPDQLVGPGVSDYLAGLIGESAASLAREWDALADEGARERLHRLHAQAWRRIVIPLVVTARTQPGELPFQIRAEVALTDQALPASPADPDDLLPPLSELLGGSALFEHLAEVIRRSRGALATPQSQQVHAGVSPYLDPEHLTFVISVMQRGSRQSVDKVRSEIDEIRGLDMAPEPVPGIVAPPERQKQQRGKPRQVGARRRHDQRHLDRLGLDAERWVRAATLNTLLSMDTEDFASAIDSLRALLSDVATGPIAAALDRRAEEAVNTPDADDRIEALVEFVHVALASDDFGFDILGLVAPYAGAEPRPTLLEVKNSADRSFHVSNGEWDLAEARPDDYAFCIVVRSSPGQPPLGMEVIPDPKRQLAEGRIARREDGWLVRYTVADP